MHSTTINNNKNEKKCSTISQYSETQINQWANNMFVQFCKVLNTDNVPVRDGLASVIVTNSKGQRVRVLFELDPRLLRLHVYTLISEYDITKHNLLEILKLNRQISKEKACNLSLSENFPELIVSTFIDIGVEYSDAIILDIVSNLVNTHIFWSFRINGKLLDQVNNNNSRNESPQNIQSCSNHFRLNINNFTAH